MGDHDRWDEHTRTAVRLIWALAFGSALSLAAIFFVLPQLGDDGDLSKWDMILFAVVFMGGAMIAFPKPVMDGIGAAVNALRTWRKNGGET